MSLYKAEMYIILTVFGYHFLYYSICFFFSPLANLLPCLPWNMQLSSIISPLKASPLRLALPPSEDNVNLNNAFEKNLYILSLQII